MHMDVYLYHKFVNTCTCTYVMFLPLFIIIFSYIRTGIHVNGASLIEEDISLTNGVIHIVDKLLFS